MHHSRIGCEHLLLGLLRLGRGEAARELHSAGIELAAARDQLVRIAGRGAFTNAPIPPYFFTPRTSSVDRVLENARRVATLEGDDKVEPVHLLEALATETSGIHVEMLQALYRPSHP